MDKIAYKTRAGNAQFRPVMSLEEYQDIDNEGFCLACGNTQGQVEPDARKYTCESCRAQKVYGFEELLQMNLIVFEGE